MSLPDLELEEDSLRDRERKRRRKRRQKRLLKEKQNPDSSIVSGGKNSNGLPIFHSTPVFESEEISPLEDKNNLAGVRFASLVDSRRISKDYYSQLLMQQEPQRCLISIFWVPL